MNDNDVTIIMISQLSSSTWLSMRKINVAFVPSAIHTKVGFCGRATLMCVPNGKLIERTFELNETGILLWTKQRILLSGKKARQGCLWWWTKSSPKTEVAKSASSSNESNESVIHDPLDRVEVKLCAFEDELPIVQSTYLRTHTC
eukprot:4299992-Amphidinium_carterae.1